jgi:SWI/SNF chromatin-remodeling complex subunit SWI1
MSNNNPHPFPDPSSLSGNHSNISQNNQQVLIQKRRQFLHGIATVMAQRNTPLPPMLTGGAFSQNYDPNTSPWKMLELGSEPGLIRIAGKEVDLYRIWGAVYQSGGGNKV